jgi:hypothetical protein
MIFGSAMATGYHFKSLLVAFINRVSDAFGELELWCP